MSYVLRSANNQVIVIDGGRSADAPYLKGFLAALGNRVEAWLLTHPHDEHMGALMALLEQLSKPDAHSPEVKAVYASSVPEDRLAQIEKRGYDTQRAFKATVKSSGMSIGELGLGDVISVDNLSFEVLGIANPELETTNDQSVVLRLTTGDKAPSILFLGDLGPEGGRKLLAGPYKNRVRSDIVQMAHHGQRGVDEDFYRAVAPRVCLWPAPCWLWDNDAQGKGKGTGPWLTLTVRDWMQRIGVSENYVSGHGPCRLDF